MTSSITEQDREERFSDLCVMAQALAEVWSGTPRFVKVTIDERLLYSVVVSAMDDIERYKQYHLADPISMKSDAVKRAAYMTHWLRRYRPLHVQYDANRPLNDDPSFLINENYCLLVACSYLSHDIGINISFPESKTYEIVYDLLYREITPDGLILFFQTIKDLALKKDVLVTG
jgi:hypothetical protein